MSDTILSRASVATERGARYGKQLVSHLGRKSVGVWDEASGSSRSQPDGRSAQPRRGAPDAGRPTKECRAMQVLYTATATATGGRQGRIRSSDGVLDHQLAHPKYTQPKGP